MITINNLQISADAFTVAIDVTTEVGQTFSSLKMWTHNNYKVLSKAVDLTLFLSQTTENESLVLNADDLELAGPYINGALYFEFVSTSGSDNIMTGVVANVTEFYECFLSRAMKVEVVDCQEVFYGDCPDCENNVPYISTLLHSFDVSLRMKHFTESAIILKNLENICDVCLECGDSYAPVKSSGASYKIENNIVRKE